MPRYLFSWESFNVSLVDELARGEGWPGAGSGDARQWLSAKVVRPNDSFVHRHKRTLIDGWLAQSPSLFDVVRQLQDAGFGGHFADIRTVNEGIEFLHGCRNTTHFRRRIRERLIHAGDVDRPRTQDNIEWVPRSVVLDPKKQALDGRKPYPFQQDAWAALNTRWAEAASTNIFQGALVMPTGSGKTYTAVHWLMSTVINAKQKVLWVAHRQELLNQAYKQFERCASVAKSEKLKLRVVSGAHSATTQIDKADDIVIASIGSLARRPEIARDLLNDPDRVVVIDEAHHAAAKSYTDLLATIADRVPRKVLGLTATFTRTTETERPILKRLFGAKPLFEVGLQGLIESKILARALEVNVRTGIDAEKGMTEKDRFAVSRFHELSEEHQERLAQESGRNKLVIDHYLQNATKYEKTLIFAINVQHAARLATLLQQSIPAEQRKRVEYVASYRPDGSKLSQDEIFADFRKDLGSEGSIDVLVNVQVATEGVDFPKLKTVFLVRPTGSEILLRQMVGRALRGPAAGGTEEAYIVNFTDDWNLLREWRTPLADVEGVALVEPPKPSKEATLPKAPMDGLPPEIPWTTLLEVSRDLLAQNAGSIRAFEVVPTGWYMLEGGKVGTGTIPVLGHQRVCWDALKTKLDAMSPEAVQVLDEGDLYEEFFGGCDEPKPNSADFGTVVEHYELDGEPMTFVELEARKKFDPRVIAQKISDEDLGERAKTALLKERYVGIAAGIYPSIPIFWSAVEAELVALRDPELAARTVYAVPVFEPRPDEMLPRDGTHDLEVLLRETLVQGATLLKLPNLPGDPSVEWSARLLKGWFGKAHMSDMPGDGRIIINVLLQSKQISADTLRFLLWHEYLHLFLRAGHTTEFRDRERMWPGVQAADRELDNLPERFGVKFW